MAKFYSVKTNGIFGTKHIFQSKLDAKDFAKEHNLKVKTERFKELPEGTF